MTLNSDSHPCAINAKADIALNNSFEKFISWHDNEYSYSNRLVDIIVYMASKD